jgi:hypothetical protein
MLQFLSCFSWTNRWRTHEAKVCCFFFQSGFFDRFLSFRCSILWFPYLNIFCLSTCHWNQSLNYISLYDFHIWILLWVRLIWHVQFCLSGSSGPDNCRCPVFFIFRFCLESMVVMCGKHLYYMFFYCYLLCFEYFLLIFFFNVFYFYFIKIVFIVIYL